MFLKVFGSYRFFSLRGSGKEIRQLANAKILRRYTKKDSGIISDERNCSFSTTPESPSTTSERTEMRNLDEVE